MTKFGKCPQCNGAMEPIAIEDARNSHGRWLNAEFTVCTQCSFPVLRLVESGDWQIIIDSSGVPTITKEPKQ